MEPDDDKAYPRHEAEGKDSLTPRTKINDQRADDTCIRLRTLPRHRLWERQHHTWMSVERTRAQGFNERQTREHCKRMRERRRPRSQPKGGRGEGRRAERGQPRRREKSLALTLRSPPPSPVLGTLAALHRRLSRVSCHTINESTHNLLLLLLHRSLLHRHRSHHLLRRRSLLLRRRLGDKERKS